MSKAKHLELSSVSMSFPVKGGEFLALDDVNLAMDALADGTAVRQVLHPHG